MNKKYINPKTGEKYCYYDRKGNGTDDCLVWAKMFEGHGDRMKYKIVKQDYTWMGFWVSTVWLGLDHSFGEGSDPLIFETMVFFKGHSELDMDRYTTEKQAVNGHHKMFKKWSNPLYVIYRLISDNSWRLRWDFKKFIRKLI